MQKPACEDKATQRLIPLISICFSLLIVIATVSWGVASAENQPKIALNNTERAPIATATYQDFEAGLGVVIQSWWGGNSGIVNNSANAYEGNWYGVITPTTTSTNGNVIFHQNDPWTTPTGYDASSYERVCAWVFDQSTTGGSALVVELQNSSGNASNQITSTVQTAPGEWRKLCWDMSDFTPTARHSDIHRIAFNTVSIPGRGSLNTISGPFRIDDIHFEENTPLACGADEVHGIIYHDYNNNGTQDRVEPGVENASVTIVNAAGITATVTSDSDGVYRSTGTFTAGDDVRVELALPNGYYAAAAGNTSVLFSQAGTCDQNIGVYQAEHFCQDNPEIATTCYVAGIYTGTNSALDVLVSFPYSSEGIGHSMNPSFTVAFTPTHAASTIEIGTTWGLAYQRSSETLFAGAMLKRLTDFGPLGTGGIYTLDYSTTPSNPTIGQWIDIADASGLNIATGLDPRVEDGIPLSDNGATPTRDQTAYDNVGKRSLGDLQLDDDSTLWFVNLLDQSLYGIPNADPSTTPTTSFGPYSIPNEIADLDCPDSDVRPWGLEFHEGTLYVGVVCSAESTGLDTNLHAYVLSFNTTTRSFTGTVFDFDLSNRYACVLWSSEPDSCTWRPWGSTELIYQSDPVGGFDTLLNPQPILSDIEFDIDGSMILGFLDRHGHQGGLQNYSGDPNDNNPDYGTMAGGDVVRVCNIGGTFELESGGICANGDTEHGFGGGYGGLINGAYGRGEYYLDDYRDYSGGLTHSEISSGGLALLPGSGSIVYSAMNPTGRINTGGLRWNNNETGLIERGAELFQGFVDLDNPNPPIFGKATGIGDVELMCALPPIEIGNRVWDDANNNGVQDPGESPLANITVELIDTDGSTVLATAVTDANGHYYFSSATGTSSASTLYNVTGLTASTNGYQLRIPLADTDLGGRSISSGNSATNDFHDNDAVQSGQYAVVAFNTGAIGENNHTYDFSFTNIVLSACGDNTTDVGGTVWRDYNANGVQDGNEPGYATNGMIVSAYGDSTTPVMTTTVNSDGTYILSSLSDGSTRYRLEFSGFPSYLQAGASGAQNGTSVQFVVDGTCKIDLGLNDPSDYCHSNPELATTCYVSGDPLAAGADMTNDDALVRFSNSVSGIGTPGVDEFLVSSVGEIGAAWGMAYDRANDRLFVSEIVKRHVGLIGNETGGVIYAVNNPSSAATTVNTYLDFVTDLGINVVDTSGIYPAMPSNNVRGLQAAKADRSVDLQGFELAAKASFGDMDISHDGKTLYVVNLGDRLVYAIDISQVDSGTKNATALPAFPDPSCTLGVARPWALEIHNGLVHLGVVCSAENGGAASNLSAHVYAYDPSNNTWNTTSLIDIPLDYTKGLVVHDSGASSWNPWTDDFNDFTEQGSGSIFGRIIHPQPILADIEFDYENSMHLAFTDRAGHQIGHRNAAPIGGNLGTAMTGGDILRTYYNQSTGLYTYETNASVGPYTSAGANNGEGRCNGANCGEFYFDDYAATGAEPLGYHREVHSSGLAHIIGTNELPAVTMDPIINRLDAQGVHWYDITTGAAVRDYEVFRSTGADATQFSKSNGLGDLELMCQAAPLEIGNYVWLDADADGVQDPSEAPLFGVQLQLWLDPDGIPGNADDKLISTTSTSADGEYYFGVQPNSNYYVAIDPDQPILSSLTLTSADYSSNSGTTDVHDSDGVLNTATNKIIATVTTGSAGQNDYTYDFGFTPLGVIGNYVWLDENSDGLQDAGESGIPNVVIILRDATNTPILTTTTDANGGYLFTDLPLGTYSVDIVDSSVPNGMTQTTIYTNGTGDFGNKDHSGNGYSVTIGGGNPLENLTADFGYNYNPTTDVNTPAGSPTAALGDRVWYDTDADGVQDPDEVGIYNVCLELFSAGTDGVFGTADDVSEGTTTTDYNGNYIFDGLTPGAYVVEVCAASLGSELNGLSQTGDPDHFGQPETGAHYEDDHKTTNPVVLGPGDVFLNVDFGYDGGTVGSIGDTIFYDYDADGNGSSMSPVDGGGAVTQGAGGSADATDTGIPAVTISLIRDLDGDGVWDTGEPIIATTITNANGQYLFAGLPLDDGGGDSDADYIVWVNDTDNVLDGLTQTYDSNGVLASPNQSAVALSSGSPDDRSQDFGYSASSPLGSIGDTIWNDVNNNGASTPDAGEPGIPNVGIKLFADSNADGTADDINGDGVVNDSDAIMTTVTDANGNYLFEGLPLDSYLVEVCDETLPAGFNTTPTYDPDGTTPNNVGAPVTLTESNPTNRDQDFSYTYTDTTLGSIGDQIWADLDAGGENAPEAGEPGLANVVVTIISSSGYSATTTTDENGFYLFENLPVGTYTVTVDTSTLPAGFNTIPSYDPDGTNDSSSAYTLAAGEHERARDFSYPPSSTPLGIIGDTVWFDIDGDGNGPDDEGTSGGDNNEPGLANVCVHLYQDLGTIGTFEPLSDTLLSSTYTDANGHYQFDGLSLDDNGGDSDFDYVVVVDTDCLPAYVSIDATYDATAPTSDSVSFTSLNASSISTGSHVDLDQDFGYEPTAALGTIGDAIWFDIDGNGASMPEAGEPGLEGVVVVLTDENGNTWTTTTDENGNYLFGNLPLNTTYTVTIPASNFASGGVLEGMNNTYDPDNNDNNAGVGVTLTETAPVNLDQDFSYTGGAGQLGNLVWLDANADGDDDSGTAGSGEGPIANVTLNLYRDLDCDGLVDAGEPLFGNTTTVGAVNAGSYGANGIYDFDNLPVVGAGTNGGACWVVDVTDANNVLAGYWHSLGTAGVDNNSQTDPYGNSGTGELELTLASPTNLTADFGYYVNPAAVGNFVWFDANYDGIQDSGELGMDGITVTLVITYPDGTHLTLMTVTGDDPATSGTTETGWYSFGNLLYDEDYAASSGAATASPAQPAHVVSMTTPNGYSITLVNAGAANDQNDADDAAGVATTTAQGQLNVTQSITPTAETNPIASYDFGLVRIELGDLPNDKYHTMLANRGARHVIWPDLDNDNVPDWLGAIWSGTLVDVETEGHSGGDNGQTTGDDLDGIDDEDGLIIPPQGGIAVGNTVLFTITVRSRGVESADYGLWIDWDGDQTFNGTNEFLSRNDIAIDQLVTGNIYQKTFVLSTTVPSGTVVYPEWIYIRGRVFEANSTTTRNALLAAHDGLASNGEVEDFATQPAIPAAVKWKTQSIEQGAVISPTLMLVLSIFTAFTWFSWRVYRPKSTPM
ncbi:MAG: SdrD B-like domain-containing protein [Candidatus Promineifilaceae bacterium]